MTRLQTNGRLKVPAHIREHYKIDGTQVLKVTINPQDVWSKPQTFPTKMTKDRRIVIPKVIMDTLNKNSLPPNCTFDVTLEQA